MLKKYLEHRARKKLNRNKEVAAILSKATTSTGCDYTDYLALYNYIRIYKPAEILELGSGLTTSLIAQALKENGSGRLTSMEEIERYYRETLRSIPSYLKPFVDLRLSSTIEGRYGPFCGVMYKDIPERPYDFVLIDGPHYDAEKSFNLDILKILEKTVHPLTAYVDSRTGSCFIYHLVLGAKFSFSYLRRLGVIDRATSKDLKNYKKIVGDAMRHREFKRRW
jgi:predicted O-methyltransferase YrrM